MKQAAELCTDCGICCDGTLFSSVSLDASALVTARAHHLPIVETATSCKFELPCPTLRGVLCGIYEERPEECADFHCELLLRVEEERLTFEEAQEIIDATRTVRARIADAIGDKPWWVARRSALEAERTSPRWAQENAALLADLNELDKLVRHHFWD